MKVVCLGDSITAGQHAPQSWADLLGYVNKGVPGDTTRLALERFPQDVQQTDADVVTIQFGHNDANCWQTDNGLPRVSLAAYRANLIEMVARARRFRIEPVLVGLTCPDRPRQYVLDCGRYNACARDVADILSVTWVPMWNTFHPSYYLDGGLHLNEDGHRLYADVIAEALADAPVFDRV